MVKASLLARKICKGIAALLDFVPFILNDAVPSRVAFLSVKADRAKVKFDSDNLLSDIPSALYDVRLDSNSIDLLLSPFVIADADLLNCHFPETIDTTFPAGSFCKLIMFPANPSRSPTVKFIDGNEYLLVSYL